MSKTKLLSTKRHIRASIRDGIYTNFNIGMSESYFCAFMLAIGISEVTSGFGTVLAQFIGVLFQLISIRSFFRKYSLKKRLILFLAFQTITMIPLIFIAKFRISSPFLTIGILGLYWGSLLSLNPPWNRLIGHTIPSKFRIKFFSIRNQFGQMAVLIGLLTTGLALHHVTKGGEELKVFVWIFIAGLILKLLSLLELKFNHNDYILPTNEDRLRLRDFLKRIKGTDQGKLLSFLFFFYISVHFSAPYFNPYMLSQLKFNYIEYMSVSSIAYFGRTFVFRILQKKAKPRHINKLLLISSIGIATSPLMWAIAPNLWIILFIEFLSGCYWAGFELSTILLYYQKIEDHERTSVITYITLFNIGGMILGSLLGGIFMRQIPDNWDKYALLFIFSTILRVLVIIIAPQSDFKGQIPKFISFNRVFMVLSPFGALTRPIIDKIKKKKLGDKDRN